jgi:protein SCO1/2
MAVHAWHLPLRKTEATEVNRWLLAVIAIVIGFSKPAIADPPADLPPALLDIGVDEHLDAELPLDAIFKDENGKMVRFGDFVDGKRPTLLVLAYHSCKTLCSFVQNAVLDSVKQQTWSIGDEYDVITLSIDSRDTPAIATDKKNQMLASYARNDGKRGWHFLTGDDQNARRVADAVGWKFHKDIDGEIAHPSAIMLLKPNGRVARYLYGIEFPANDLRMGLLEASEGRSITTAERVLLYCYHYDAHDRKYSLIATHVMQIGGGLTLLLMVGFIGGMWLKERRKRHQPPLASAVQT